MSHFGATLLERERFRERYESERDPIAQERLRCRAHVVRHLVHPLPGQSILELGGGSGRFALRLAEATHGENPITLHGFDESDVAERAPREPAASAIERVVSAELPGALRGRSFDVVIARDLLDATCLDALLDTVHALLRPGGQFVAYDSNPWNPALHVYRALGRLVGRRDPRALSAGPRLVGALAAHGFERPTLAWNDFLFRPLTRPLVWRLRNVAVLLENMPGLRCLAGALLVHARKPEEGTRPPRASLARHAELRGAVSVVIPCWREEATIGPLVSGLCELFGDYLHEILPVHDESPDGTRAVLERLAAEDPRVKPIFRAPPPGVGRAIADGLRAATGRWILSLDCDFEHLLPELRDLFDAAVEGYDVVVGSRFSRESVLLNYPFPKIVANRGFHLLAQVALMRRFHDLTNNLKLLRREVASRLVLTQPGFAVNAETGLEPLLLGYRVRECPISWVNRAPGMGSSSFRLVPMGGGYLSVLTGLALKTWFGVGRYRALPSATVPRATTRESYRPRGT